MSVLHLTLKKQWFDMVASGDKPWEYREIKPYWTKRLFNTDGTPKIFDKIIFTNGYRKDSPKVAFEHSQTEIGIGFKELGAPTDRKVYIIELWERIDV